MSGGDLGLGGDGDSETRLIRALADLIGGLVGIEAVDEDGLVLPDAVRAPEHLEGGSGGDYVHEDLDVPTLLQVHRLLRRARRADDDHGVGVGVEVEFRLDALGVLDAGADGAEIDIVDEQEELGAEEGERLVRPNDHLLTAGDHMLKEEAGQHLGLDGSGRKILRYLESGGRRHCVEVALCPGVEEGKGVDASGRAKSVG